jgi:hypothetical protein
MAPSNLTSLRTQARYIDEAISHLNSKLNYPGSLFRPSRISHTEEILEELMSENEAILVNDYPVILKSIVCYTYL